MIIARVACAAPAAEKALPHDLLGQAIDPFADNKSRALVLVFIAPDCPISNRYIPQLNEIAGLCARENVAFWLVYPDRETTRALALAHKKEYAISARALLDPDHRLVKQAAATVTPEAAVFLPGPAGQIAQAALVYRGQINNLYSAFGVSRPEPTEHDLRDVIAQITRGEKPAVRTTQAVGCYITQ